MINMTKPNLRKKIKRTLIGLTALATIFGTYSSHEEDLPPLYVSKIGKSGGICFVARSDNSQESKFYGVNISLAEENRGKIYGANISLCGENKGEVYGTSVSLLPLVNSGVVYGPVISIVSNASKAGKIRGLEGSLICNAPFSENKKDENGKLIENEYVPCQPSTVDGLQFSIFYNEASANSNCLQIGLVNRIRSSDGRSQWGLLLNYNINSEKRQ